MTVDAHGAGPAVGLPVAWIGSRIHPAFVTLGYDPLTGDSTLAASGNGVAE